MKLQLGTIITLILVRRKKRKKRRKKVLMNEEHLLSRTDKTLKLITLLAYSLPRFLKHPSMR